MHAVVGGYATRAWGIEIDRVKCDKGNAFMRYAAAEMAKRNAAWGAIDVPAIRCAPIEDVSIILTSGSLHEDARVWSCSVDGMT